MALTTAQREKLETKANAAASKSEGMRILFEQGYTVSEAAEATGVAYGFAYGVARRAGYVGNGEAEKPAPKAKAAAPSKETKAAPKASTAKGKTAAPAPAPKRGPGRPRKS